jgi:serine/threonine protein kinase
MTAAPQPSPQLANIGPYRLLARIGEGGMGVVHLAQTVDGRRVALKVLRPHVVGDAEARERLAREVSSLRRVTSPRVAEILDADPHGPTPYVVTRYVPGLSLYHHVAEEGPITGRDLIHFADALAEALQAVHSVGVLHRDIKPTNVLMEGRSPVLIDFGLARLADDPRLTQTGFLLGTPGYLAPEILYGEDGTPAADVHSWAATVVFAATGRPPYGRGPAMAVMDRARRGEHDLSDVPQGLVPVLRDCLEPEPWQRPTLSEVRTWLGEQQTPRPVEPVAERELWTMPFYPASPTGTAPEEDTPPTGIAPLHAPVEPAAAPAPSAPTAQVTEAPHAPPRTRIIPAPAQPTTSAPTSAPARDSSRVQQVGQLLGLGALAGSMVAYAPYAGTAVVGLVVLILRMVSVTRQRHSRRRLLRGRTAWYDVPATTLSLPVYLLVALAGSLVLLFGAAFTALGMYSLGYVLGQPEQVDLVLAGAGFVPALWWGPGATRLRESTRALVVRTARTELGGWFVVVACLLGAAVMLGLLTNVGPNWAPALSPPWHFLR